MAEIEKIYARGTNWVGDAVMTIPALRELRRVFPLAKITLHTRGWARGIFEDAEFLDEILTFEKGESKIKDAFKQSKTIRERNFDLAVLFPNSFETALIVKLAGIPQRFGYAKEARAILLTDAVKIPEWKNERHEVYYYLNLVAEIEKKIAGTQSILANEPNVDLQVSYPRKLQAREILTANGVDLSRKIVALGVGSTNSRAKRWQAESYAKLNDKLQNELNADVILIGANDELEVASEVHTKSERKPVILTGKTSLAEATAILSVVDLLVSNDMGLAHVATATGTKTLVIFGPTKSENNQTLERGNYLQKSRMRPVYAARLPIDHRCMMRITAEEVFAQAAQKLLQ